MSSAMFLLMILFTALVPAANGNSNTSVDGGNSSVTAPPISLAPGIQNTSVSTDNASYSTSNPELKKGACYDFEVFVINNQLNIPYTVTCCVAVLCGFYLVLFGYRFFKFSLFLLGFLFATFVTFIICSIHAELPAWGLVSVSLAVGVFCGLLTMFVIYCGLFLGGFGLGFFIGIAIFYVIETFFHITIKWIPFGVLMGLSLIFALLTLRWQKGFFIVATSLIGAALITCGVDYFIEEFVLLNYTWQRIMAGDGGMKCWVTWVILAVWPVMFVLGNVVQFCKTGRTYTHRKRTDSLTLQGEDKALQRYRNSIMNGDVVAKAYHSREEEGRPTEV